MAAGDQLTLLHVDDNQADLDLMEIAIGDCRPDIAYLGFARADSALAHLGDRVAGNLPLPALIVLDLNMPVMHGRELLAHLKRDAALSGVPVVIYSSSQRQAECDDCTRLGAVAVIPKAASYESLLASVRTLLAHVPAR